ncbi:MAG: immunoglobulin domain-containing protein, partial [Opitutus sp.]
LTIVFTITGTLTLPESWTTGGSVPPGMSFSGKNSATLVLSGTPTTAGSYVATIRAHNSNPVLSTATFTYTVNVGAGESSAPVITTQPASRSVSLVGSATFTAAASGNPAPTYQWQKNGAAIPGATGASLAVNNVQSADAGFYTVVATNSAGSATSAPAILAPVTTQKVMGAAFELQGNIQHPNGNRYDQLLLTGSAATFTADAGQVTRISYIDLSDDIVQLEFSGAGSVTLVLDAASGPATPINYNQAVNYMKGHGSVYLAGTSSNSYVSAFTVGRLTAFDPTGAYDISKPISETNKPSNNGNSIFQAATDYDGLADLGSLAIVSSNNTFGGVLTANTNYWKDQGQTGIYGPGVLFADGRVYLHDLTAFGEATPMIRLGSAANVRVTGGNLLQDNNRAVQVSGFTSILLADGTDSHGNLLLAKANQARLEEDGVDVTDERVTGGPAGNGEGDEEDEEDEDDRDDDYGDY